MMLNPGKITQYKMDVMKTENDIRESYERVNLTESYPALFELLWYSQLPCFDVMNVTTQDKEEHG